MNVSAVTDKKTIMSSENLNPHYTNPLFKKPQTIFFDPKFKIVEKYGQSMIENAEYLYSDRLMQEFGEKCEEAAGKAKNETKENTPEFFEIYLQALLNRPNLKLVHIISGVNIGNGYPYRIYGFLKN